MPGCGVLMVGRTLPRAVRGCSRPRNYTVHTTVHNGPTVAVALGRRLMRVLPEDAFDRQPLIGGEGRYVLVADIRLDNRDELTEALRIPAPQARNLCDAAILLAAIERWDESCLERIVGDYAFAVWDGARRRLLLARDPLGQRPLHYHRGNKFFAFASMPKGLHALPEIPYAPDEERIAELLVLMPETGTKSFFAGIERVEPGHVVAVTANGLATRRHWQPSRRRIALRRPEDYSEALRELLDQAVSCRLRGTGDVGAYLSGGLDSGAVAATAARLLAPSGRRLIAFTGVPREGYDGPAPRNRIIDEGPHAAATAALYPNIEHVLVRNEGRSPLEDLDRNFFLSNGPLSVSAAAGWANSMNNAMRKRNVRVILSGSCGNMGLSYDGMELLPELFRSGRWLRLWREARALLHRGGCAGAAFWPKRLVRGVRRLFGSGSIKLQMDTLWKSATIRQSIPAVLPNSISQSARRHAISILSTGHGKTVSRCGSGLLQRMDPGNYRKGRSGCAAD